MGENHVPVAALASLNVLLAGLAPLPACAAAKPNILFILVDNLGDGELGAYGGGRLSEAWLTASRSGK